MVVAELVLEYLKALAWPIVVFVAIALFRRELSTLFGRVTEASAFGASIKLAKNAEEAADASADLPELRTQTLAEPYPVADDSASTLGRMMLAWNELEDEVRKTVSEMGLSGERSHNVALLVQQIHRAGKISTEAVSLARALQDLRNRLVHNFHGITVTASAADNFIAATRRLRAAVQQVSP